MLNPQTTWQEEEKQVFITAVEGEKELNLKLERSVANPDNDKQPYINFHFPLFHNIYANIFEYSARYSGHYIENDQILDLCGEGITHLTEAVW